MQTHLSLHIHDNDGVGSVTDHKLFCVPGQWMYAVHCDVSAYRAT